MFDEAKPYCRRLGGNMRRPTREMHRRSEASEGTRLRQAIARRGRKAVHVRESRMTLSIEIANFITEAEYDDRATCSVF